MFGKQFFSYKFDIANVNFKVKHYFKKSKHLILKYHIYFFSEFFYTQKVTKINRYKMFNVSSLSVE